MQTRLAAMLGCLLAVGANAATRDFHYGAIDDPALLNCESANWSGDNAAAIACFSDIAINTDDDYLKAEASWGLGDLKAANRWFRKSLKDSPARHRVRTRWGDLYAATHQNADAMELYREVMAHDPDDVYAALGAAAILADQFSADAVGHLRSVVDRPSSPAGARMRAHILLARMLLEQGEAPDAERHLDDAQQIADRSGYPPLEIFALRAAMALLQERDASDWVARALKLNPAYGNIHAVPAHFQIITRRYREGIALLQQAVSVQPGLANAHEQLGVNLLRVNRFALAREHLERAHELDPYSPVAVNTLRLLDSLDRFDQITDPDPATAAGPYPLSLRLHKREAQALRPYVTKLARESIRHFSKRYDFALSEPVVIEMYPDHEDFIVRSVGMPGLPILGVTFGYVVAMDSPSGQPPETFQWGTTLWHEMAHVFTLEASEHRVPRWFSEGVSVFEEWDSGPGPGIRLHLSALQAMADERLLPIDDLDNGFLRPEYPDQVIVSYMQAGLVCQFIAERYGVDRLRQILQAYRDRQTTREALRTTLNLEPAQFDAAFLDWLQQAYAPVYSRLDEWRQAQHALGLALDAEQWDAVLTHAGRSLELFRNYSEPDSAWLASARAHDALGNETAALDALESWWRHGGYEPKALQDLAARLWDENRHSDAIAAMRAANMVAPLDIELHRRLGEWLLAQGNAAEALTEYRVALALAPHDVADAHYRVATAYKALGQLDDARQQLLLALDAAPAYRPAQQLLLQILRPKAANET